MESKECTDFVGYETFIDFIKANDILAVDGNLVDIGVFLGGGTRKLSKFLTKNRSTKTLYAIDIFNPTVDQTRDMENIAMASYYQRILDAYACKSQWEMFSQTIKGCKNIVVIKGDTRDIEAQND